LSSNLENEKHKFRKLDLFLSSGEVENILLGPLERANLNHQRTEIRNIVSSKFRIPDDGRSPKTHHRQNPLQSTWRNPFMATYTPRSIRGQYGCKSTFPNVFKRKSDRRELLKYLSNGAGAVTALRTEIYSIPRAHIYVS
jgi:predicted oxidoreductase